MIRQAVALRNERATSGEIKPPISQPTWPEFYEKIRMDIIEAQCALASGRAHRAIELMEEMLRDATSCNLSLACDSAAAALPSMLDWQASPPSQ